MTAREEILGRIEAVLPGRAVADVAAAYAAIDRPYLSRHHQDGVLDLFAERVADYRAIVHRVTPEGLPAAIAAALSPRTGSYVLPTGLPTGWVTEVDPARLVPEETAGDLDELAGVITGCAVAIAETGTIVLDHGPGQGRRALTLVPDHHVVVVTAGQVAPDVPEALGRLTPTLPLTFVSGPSATSDIELSRVEGVHGPRLLEVIIST
jgi:L-lactate dehydrogenase complex protein LldG